MAGEQNVRVKRPDSSLIPAKISIRSITCRANSLFVMLNPDISGDFSKSRAKSGRLLSVFRATPRGLGKWRQPAVKKADDWADG
jgi:hypothetical protein